MSRSLRLLCSFEVMLTQKENDKGKGEENERKAEEKMCVREIIWERSLMANVLPCS